MSDERPPPRYAVIFVSQLRLGAEGYERTAQRMVELAQRQPGFHSIESVRDPSGLGVTISYWDSLGAIDAWKADAEHREAQRTGKERWYSRFAIQVCRIERASGFLANDDG